MRFWSEEVVQQIADGNLTWEDVYRIDMLRLTLSQQNRKTATESKNEEFQLGEGFLIGNIPQEVRAAKPPPPPPCRHFNAGSCNSRTHHLVKGYRYLHICAYCIYNKCSYLPHTEGNCRSKNFRKQLPKKEPERHPGNTQL